MEYGTSRLAWPAINKTNALAWFPNTFVFVNVVANATDIKNLDFRSNTDQFDISLPTFAFIGLYGLRQLESHSRTERLLHVCRELRAPQNQQ